MNPATSCFLLTIVCLAANLISAGPAGAAQDSQAQPILYFAKPSLGTQSAFPMFDLAVAPDGKQIAVATSDGRIQLRESEKGQILRITKGHDGPIYRVRFSGDGSELATCGRDGTLRLWSIPDLKQLKRVEVSEQPLLDLAFSGSNRVVVGGYDGVVRMVHRVDGEPLQTAPGSPTRAIAVSADNTRLAAAGSDGKVRILSPEDLHVVAELEHNDAATAVCFSRNGESLFVGTRSGEVHAWRMSDKKRLYRQRRSAPVSRLEASRNGATLFVGTRDGSVATFRVMNGQQLTSHEQRSGGAGNAVVGIGTTEDDGRLWVGSRDLIQRYDAQRPKRPPTLTHSSTTGRIWALDVWSQPEGQQEQGLMIVYGGKDKAVYLHDIKNRTTRQLGQRHPATLDRLTISPRGDRIAGIGWKSESLSVWDTVSGKLTIEDKVNGPLRSVVFSPDGRQVATIGEDGRLNRWDVESKKRKQIQAHSESATGVSFRSDGRLIATASGAWRSSEPGTLKLWKADSLSEDSELKGHESWIQCVEFSPKDNRLASADGHGIVKVWDSETGNEVASFGNPAPVRTIAWSCDARFLAVGMDTGTISVWSLATTEVVADLGTNDDVFGVRFAPGDHSICATSGGREWLLWDVSDITGTTFPKWLAEIVDSKRAEQ